MKSVSQARVPALDGLRSVAVALVLAGHGAEAYVPDVVKYPFLSPLFNSSLGVRLFFVLSGFLITSLLLKEYQQRGSVDLMAFMGRRALRIWPALYFYLVVMIALVHAGIISISSGQFFSAATFLWNYSPLLVPHSNGQGWWFLGHLWTLSLEQQFYLVWPFMIMLVGWRRVTIFAFAVPFLLPLLRVLIYFMLPGQRGLLGMMFHTAIDSILIGCIFALCQHHIRGWLAATPWIFSLSLIFVFLISPILGDCFSPYRITVGFGLDAVCCGILILSAQLPFDRFTGLWSGFLSLPPLVFIGSISYGLYLWQQPFLTSLNSTISGRFPLSIVAALLCAILSYNLIEKPALRAKRIFARAEL